MTSLLAVIYLSLLNGMILDPLDRSNALFIPEGLVMSWPGETLPLTWRQRAKIRRVLRPGVNFTHSCDGARGTAVAAPLDHLRDSPVIIAGTVLHVWPGWSPVTGAPASRIDIEVTEVIHSSSDNNLAVGMHVYTVTDWGSLALQEPIYEAAESSAHATLARASSCDPFAPLIVAREMQVVLAGSQYGPGVAIIRRDALVPILRGTVRFDLVPHWRWRYTLPLHLFSEVWRE